MNNSIPTPCVQAVASSLKEEAVHSQGVAELSTSHKKYRSTINVIPKEISVMNVSRIPFTINVVPESFVDENVELSQDPIVRCEKCKTYINPFVEVIPPGTLWKCNMCQSINNNEITFRQIRQFERNGPFNPLENYAVNTSSFLNPELRNNVVDIIAPSSFSIKPSSDPIFFFAVEATTHMLKNGIFRSVLNCIVNNMDILPNSSLRTKVVVSFFNSSVFIVKKAVDTRFLVVSDFEELPSFYPEDILLKKDELALDVDALEEYFTNRQNNTNDFGGCLAAIRKFLAGRGGTAMVFLGTVPNAGHGAIDTSRGDVKCKSVFYKNKAFEFTKATVAVNLFLFPHLNVELPTLSVLSKYTGGVLNYYPNYDADDFSFSSKLSTDFSLFLEQNIGHEAVCKVRVPNGVSVKEYYGNLNLRSSGIISFCNFYPSHSFTFEITVDEPVTYSALTVQVALLRSLESGEKVIRILNFAIPTEGVSTTDSFYESLDANMIAHSWALKAVFNEADKRGSGNSFLIKELREVSNCYKKNMKIGTKEFVLPDSLRSLPSRVMGLMKSIPLRPVSYTPMDYRAYYMYLWCTQYPKLIDVLVYPTLYSLHNLGDREGLVDGNRVVMPRPIKLTLDLLETSGFYMLDTGVNIYFFVGRDCNTEIPDLVINPHANGRFVFEKFDNDMSERVCNVLKEIRAERFLTPNYYVIRDRGQPDLLIDIFFSYFVEDAIHNLPASSEFVKKLNE